MHSHRGFFNERRAGKQSINQEPGDDVLVICLAGFWTTADELPDDHEITAALESGPSPRTVRFDASGLSGWDSSLLTLLVEISKHCSQRGLSLETGGLPEGARRLLKLASAVPERQGAHK